MKFKREMVLTVVVLAMLDLGCGDVSVMSEADGGDPEGMAGSTGQAGTTGGAGTMGGAGTTGAGGSTTLRANGASCTADEQCGSNVCDTASGACCDSRPGECSTCISGVNTPKANDTPCSGGTVCSGEDIPTGFGGTVKSASTTHVCRAGACAAVTTECSSVSCPAACNLKYKGCVESTCWCVNVTGGVCS